MTLLDYKLGETIKDEDVDGIMNLVMRKPIRLAKITYSFVDVEGTRMDASFMPKEDSEDNGTD